MAISNLQERIERSLFEAIRLVLVAEGFIPDITNTGLYGSEPYTQSNMTAWKNSLTAIINAKGFTIGLYQNSQTKGMKEVPRIVILTRRVLMGEVSLPQDSVTLPDPSSLTQYIAYNSSTESSTFFLGIHLISNTEKQDRVLGGILQKALGKMRYIKFVDDNEDSFLIERTSDFDLPDPTDTLLERVYTYKVSDLFDIADAQTNPVSPLKQVLLGVTAVDSMQLMDALLNPLPGNSIDRDGTLDISKDGINEI